MVNGKIVSLMEVSAVVDLGIPKAEGASTLKVECQHIIWPVSPEIKRACTTCTQRGVHITWSGQ